MGVGATMGPLAGWGHGSVTVGIVALVVLIGLALAVAGRYVARARDKPARAVAAPDEAKLTPARALDQAAARLAGRPTGGLGTVLELIEGGRRDDLARAVAAGSGPGDRFSTGLRDLIVIAMVDAGAARPGHPPAPPVIGRNGDELDVGPLVTLLLAEPPDVVTVQVCLAAMGVDLAAV
ncbi:MAG: hypothetical protein ACM30G_01320 [Micromonosporaceae bacterium]